MKRSSFVLRLFVLSSFLVLGLTSPATAQLCFGPDNLNGPCCSFTVENLPTPLPTPNNLRGIGICWTACSPTTTNAELVYGPITNLWCGTYTGSLTVEDGAGTVLMAGTQQLEYTRTWEETNFNAETLQVWRFLVKVDLQAAIPTPVCPVPGPIAHSSFYYGYLDIVFNCFTGATEFATCLFHACDKFIHHPIASSIPGPLHPQVAYGLVAPVSAANPFTPIPLPPVFGPATGGGTRRGTVPGTTCATEEVIPAGGANLSLIAQACACPLNFSLPLQYAAQPLSLGGACGTTSSSIWTPNPFPWVHMITTSLGTWTGSGVGTPYPGPEAAWVNEGFFFTFDGCTGIPYVEVYYGAMTDQGFPVTPDPQRPWQTTRFLDLASNYAKSTGINPPWVGTVRGTARLIYMNF